MDKIKTKEIQAGSINISTKGPSVIKGNDTSKFTTVTFPNPFPKDAKVIVTASVETFHGVESPDLRIADITPTGFKVRMNEIVVSDDGKHKPLSDGAHLEETIGWIAVSI